MLIGGELTAWGVKRSTSWQTNGPVNIVSLSEGPDLEISATDRTAGLTAMVRCDAVGTLAISLQPFILIKFGLGAEPRGGGRERAESAAATRAAGWS